MPNERALLASRLAWLTGLRLGLLTLLLAAVGALYLRDRQLVGDVSSRVMLATVASGFALAGLTAAALRAGWHLVELAYAQLVVDQITWTVLAYVSGGVTSGATSFYGLSCVVGAVLAGVPGVLVAAGSAAALYSAMTYGFASHLLLPPRDQPIEGYATAWRDLSFPFVLNLLVLVVVGLLAGYLAERLRRTRGELDVARQRAVEAERLAALGRFAAALAHEIRNPLGSIAGSAELLATATSLGEEDRILCGIISREASRLNDLVTDMLDLAKPRVPDKVPMSVTSAAKDVVHLAAESGRGSDVRVRYEGPEQDVVIDADPAMFRQVLWNLVRNAVQASGAGDVVRVRVTRRAGEVAVEVVDRGPGIPEAAREHLFDAFFTTRSHGVGIGLAVVKKIVDEHGWKIDVESPGKGVTFRVTIPERSAALPAADGMEPKTSP